MLFINNNEEINPRCRQCRDDTKNVDLNCISYIICLDLLDKSIEKNPSLTRYIENIL